MYIIVTYILRLTKSLLITNGFQYEAKCRMVLTYDAYSETLEKQQEKESGVQKLQEKYEQDMKSMREEMNQQFGQIMSMIQQNPKLAQIKPEVLSKKM